MFDIQGCLITHYPATDKWSKQKVLGHLVDSAINNLKRFTEAQFAEQPYVIIPYRPKLICDYAAHMQHHVSNS